MHNFYVSICLITTILRLVFMSDVPLVSTTRFSMGMFRISVEALSFEITTVTFIECDNRV